MTRSTTVAALVALTIGLAGGALGMRLWFDEWTHADSALHEDHDEDEHDDCEHANDELAHAGEAESIRLGHETLAEIGIKIAQATGGQLERTISLPGEIVLNADRLAHIVPRVSGIVRQTTKSLGDTVQPGDVLAIIESRNPCPNS